MRRSICGHENVMAEGRGGELQEGAIGHVGLQAGLQAGVAHLATGHGLQAAQHLLHAEQQRPARLDVLAEATDVDACGTEVAGGHRVTHRLQATGDVLCFDVITGAAHIDGAGVLRGGDAHAQLLHRQPVAGGQPVDDRAPQV